MKISQRDVIAFALGWVAVRVLQGVISFVRKPKQSLLASTGK